MMHGPINIRFTESVVHCQTWFVFGQGFFVHYLIWCSSNTGSIVHYLDIGSVVHYLICCMFGQMFFSLPDTEMYGLNFCFPLSDMEHVWTQILVRIISHILQLGSSGIYSEVPFVTFLPNTGYSTDTSRILFCFSCDYWEAVY